MSSPEQRELSSPEQRELMVAKAGRRRPFLVSFSGIDGAGKSTQISNLISHLGAAGLNIKLITFWDDVARLKGIREGAGHTLFKGDKGVGTPDAPIARRDKNVRSPLMTLVRLALYVIDALSLRSTVRKTLHLEDTDIIIFDRYLYDELANLNLQNRLVRFYVRLLVRLIPKPDISFVLDADPVHARARKPEYPLDFLHLNRNAYLNLSSFLGDVTVIPPLSIEAAKATVVKSVFDSKCLPLQENRPT